MFYKTKLLKTHEKKFANAIPYALTNKSLVLWGTNLQFTVLIKMN